ncbi:DUF1285 domain-containing protein [Mangrovimicrobium sediminis]|uniref:DUF1285 domain-containing protein n=1 Tax=Mangrovimicrobium sediminis TaxID=2562682 RepID=A0A4Z0M2S5_9GAMM|nr:DUF1285 domain-containing protein [Haliea sp. SAOS-164]TGD73658.1 DUF1285 domain-containing protein [Haliea sp. SAOS-164]
MSDSLEQLEARLGDQRSRRGAPPLHLWHPQLSGEIDIRIAADGTWYHQGDPILREPLRNLFASILRREDDGHYYLVTPVEKWRIRVELHPLQVVDVDEQDGRLVATLNTGLRYLIGDEHPLVPEPSLDGVAVLQLPHGLSALFARGAWYRLVAMADSEQRVHSGDYTHQLGAGT